MTAPEALEFLANRIEQEARVEGTQLSEIERKMLRWSEVEPGACKDKYLSERFEHDFHEDQWEEKIIRLAKRAYVADNKNPATTQFWTDARLALLGHDYYLLTTDADDVRSGRPVYLLRLHAEVHYTTTAALVTNS